MALGLLVGCGGARELEPDFVLHVDHGWSCQPNRYVGLDKHDHVRIETFLPQASIRFPDYVLGATIFVWTGDHLDDEAGTDPCDGELDGPDVEIDYLYQATDGVGERFVDGPDLGVTLDQVTLTPDPEDAGVLDDPKWDKLDPVPVDHATFPAFPDR
jgi:hypothetical protein